MYEKQAAAIYLEQRGYLRGEVGCFRAGGDGAEW